MKKITQYQSLRETLTERKRERELTRPRDAMKERTNISQHLRPDIQIILNYLLHCVTLITCVFFFKPASIASWHGVSLVSFVLHLKKFSKLREREGYRVFNQVLDS